MKIAYIYPALNTVGGADRIIVQKANYFADRYHYDVYIITAHQCGSSIFFPLSANVKHIDLDVDFGRQYGKPLLQRSLIYRRLQKTYRQKLSALLHTIKADVVLTTISRDIDFLHEIEDGSIKIAESHTPKEFVRNLHLFQERSWAHRIVARIWKRKVARAVSKFDALVVLTAQDAEKWAREKKAYVIQNAFPFYPEQQSTCMEKRVISVGRLEMGKGYDVLINAWRTIADRFPEWKLYLYGRGTLEHELKAIIAANALEDHVFIEAPVANIQDKYLESSFYVMTSSFEGLPMVLIEAMTCGLPTISFDCPVGPSEIIKHEEDGFLVDNGNVEELIEKISALITDEKLRVQMGMKARENVKRYHPDTIMKQWAALFDTLKTGKSDECLV